MKSEIHIVDTAECCHIDIEGTIGVPEEWQFEHPEDRVATYEKFREALQRISEIRSPEVVVNIRSTGGDVNDALLIHDALCGLDAGITTRCYGYTASAATIIAQAASEGCREISANALYLVHEAICTAEGNAAELEGHIDLLRQTDARIAAVYAARSGRPAEEFVTLMSENNGRGRWLSPEEAVAAGLADSVIDVTEQKAEKRIADHLTEGWRRLMSSLGLAPGADRTDGEPNGDRTATQNEVIRKHDAGEECNVLHLDRGRREWLRNMEIAADEKRRSFSATEVSRREDPSYGETLRSANEQAYAEDVKALRKQ